MATENTSVFLAIILAVSGICMMTALLTCYVCIFRDLCCHSYPFRSKRNAVAKARTKRRRKREGDTNSLQKYGSGDVMTLYDYTQQAESMPTESENL